MRFVRIVEEAAIKLLECLLCHDLVRLYTEPRFCHCRRSGGHYINDIEVVLLGECRAIGIDTGELRNGTNGTWHVSSRVRRST